MKKWGIFVIVVLCGLLVALQFFSRKSAVSVPAPSGQQHEEVGVSLPPSATGYVVPETVTPKPAPVAITAVQGTGDYASLMLPALPVSYMGACQGGSLEEMRMTHGKYWGYFARNLAFSFEDTRRMYDYTAAYVACSALARGSVELCGSMPGKTTAPGMKVDAKMGLSGQCKHKATPILFLAFLASKNKNSASCYSAISGWSQKILNKISVPDLCAAASQGLPQVREYLMKAVPDHDRKIKRFLPLSKSDCGSNAACQERFATYKALKDGDVSECPRSSGGLCEAAVTKSAAYCQPVVAEMSKFYCATVEKVKKEHKGYIGMTAQEIKAETDQAQAEKKAAEKQKAENDRIQAEINKKIKNAISGE